MNSKIFNAMSVLIALLGGFFGWFLGGYDGFIYALVVFVVIDYITGIMLAICDKKISSKIGFKGIFKKVLIFILVGMANLVDCEIIQNGETIRDMVIFFYLSNEGISIIENSVKIGLPVPEKLKSILEQISKEKKVKK
jgi:toxin secretion/phage lysis holin